ncbi:hypothetical protein FKM82_014047 [Ascaphus truei]
MSSLQYLDATFSARLLVASSLRRCAQISSAKSACFLPLSRFVGAPPTSSGVLDVDGNSHQKPNLNNVSCKHGNYAVGDQISHY